MEFCHDNAIKYGYVETFFGRRRRVPDLFLPTYEAYMLDGFEWKYPNGLDDNMKKQAVDRISSIKWFKKRQEEISELARIGIGIKDNSQLIAKAERQLVNSTIQGSSASITKRAMILIYNHPRLREMGVHIVLSVHDEVQCSVPIEHVKEAVPIIEKCMIDGGKDLIVPLTCDVCIAYNWYGEEYNIGENGELVPIEEHKEKEIIVDYDEEDEEEEDDN